MQEVEDFQQQTQLVKTTKYTARYTIASTLNYLLKIKLNEVERTKYTDKRCSN